MQCRPIEIVVLDGDGHVLNNLPRAVMEALATQAPDLVLLDHMPPSLPSILVEDHDEPFWRGPAYDADTPVVCIRNIVERMKLPEIEPSLVASQREEDYWRGQMRHPNPRRRDEARLQFFANRHRRPR